MSIVIDNKQQFSNKQNHLKATAVTKSRAARSSTIALALLPLAACGGGGSGPTTSPPSPPPKPDFIEDPAHTFTARDDNDRTLDMSSTTFSLTVYGKGGNDTITTGKAPDIIDGGGGDDIIISGDHNDILRGGEGADILTAGIGENSLWGGPGKDILNGGGRTDLLYLLESNGDIEDSFDGGDGLDTLVIESNIGTIFSLDFSTLDVINIEAIWLSDGDQSLTLNAQDVVGSMYITGDMGDSLISTSLNWTFLSNSTLYNNGSYGLRYIEGEFFLQFEDGDTRLLINVNVERIGFPEIISGFIEDSPNHFIYGGSGLSFLDKHAETADLTVIGHSWGNDIFTGSGSDIIYGGEAGNNIGGGAGNDEIWGGAWRDTLAGGEGDDLIYGEDGWDKIYGNDGNDILYGGDGDYDKVYGGNGNDKLYGGAGDDTLYGGEGVDVLNGGAGNDTLFGNDSNYFNNEKADPDFYYGGEGNDVIWAYVDDTIDGGPGKDRILFIFPYNPNIKYELDLSLYNITNIESIGTTYRSDTILFGPQDVIDVTDSNNTLRLYGGTAIASGDWIAGPVVQELDFTYNHYTQYYLSYTSGSATLLVSVYMDRSGFPDDGEEFTQTSSGNYTANDDTDSYINLDRRDYDFTITGKGGNDVIIISGYGSDVIYGGDGSDLILAGDGNDIIEGGAGNDILEAGWGNDELYGGDGDDRLIGDQGNDLLDGGLGNDFLDGRSGSDTLIGGGGNDVIRINGLDFTSIDGGEGTDTLILFSLNIDLDLSTSIGDLITNIEEIDLMSSGENSLTLTATDLLDLSTTSDQLIVLGGAGDSLTSTGQGWAQGVDQVVEGETYNVYTSGDATLLVDTDITQDIT